MSLPLPHMLSDDLTSYVLETNAFQCNFKKLLSFDSQVHSSNCSTYIHDGQYDVVRIV